MLACELLVWLDMDKRLQVAVMAAVLLGGGGGAYFYVSDGSHHRPGALQVSLRSDVLDQCVEGARMTYDVQWAAACSTQGGEDDSAECDLPPAKAAVVNAWLNDAEKECLAEARRAR